MSTSVFGKDAVESGETLQDRQMIGAIDRQKVAAKAPFEPALNIVDGLAAELREFVGVP